MSFSVKLYGKLSRDQQNKILEQIEKDNAHIPQFSEKFRTLALFTVQKQLNSRTVDLFSFNSRGRNMAVGYRIHSRDNRFFAEPWVWIVDDMDKNVGTEITQLQDNSFYFGTFIPQKLFQTYGSSAYNVMLGNLRLLQQCSMRKISL